MRKRLLAGWATAIVLMLAGAADAQASSGAAGQGDLKLAAERHIDRRLVELTFTTPALDDPTHVRVLLPSGYQRSHRRYPVLYLLHGAIDDYRGWTDEGNAERITAGKPLIVVMPDAGSDGYYSDWWNFGKGGPPEWETYHIDQLLPWVQHHLRTVPGRRGRAVAGLSMGGFGAFSYAARHPDRFAAAASFSGAIDTNYKPFIALMEATPSQYGLWGPHDTQEIRWRGHNPWDLASNLRGLDLTIRTGTGQTGGPYGGGDPIEAGVHAMSVSMHQKLERLGISHVWDDYGPGGHAWPYWKRDLRETLPDLLATFRHPPSRPTHFSFTAAEPTYEDYGWRVAVHRKAMEWSRLHVSGRRGFRLSGSGVGLVRTAGLFRPGSRHRLATRCPSGTSHSVKRAGAKGQFRVRLPLGPANPDQEYTAAAQLTGTKVFTCHARISGPVGRTVTSRPAPRSG